MKIQIDEDCNNAPKKAVVRDLLSALARGQHDTVLRYMSDDVTWEPAGAGVAVGHEQVGDLMPQLAECSAVSFTVTDILSHGDRCAARGAFDRADGSRLSVAHFFRFTGHGKNAKIRRVATHTTDIDAKDIDAKDISADAGGV